MKTQTGFKKFTAWLLTLAMLMTFIPSFTLTASAATITPVQPSGAGTASVPYQIGTAAELYWFANEINTGNNNIYGELTTNIDLNPGIQFTFIPDTGLVEVQKNNSFVCYLGSGILGNGSASNTTFDTTASTAGYVYTDASSTAYSQDIPDSINLWKPIGDYNDSYAGNGIEYEFIGHFDGKNYSISGLFSNKFQYSGLFGIMGTDADDDCSIKNVSVVNSYVCNRVAYTGGICGSMKKGTISGCYNAALICGANNIGGVVGSAGIGTVVDNCSNSGTVYAKNASVGGICGFLTAEIKNCYNTGDIYSTNTEYNTPTGGICGTTQGTSTTTAKIFNCYNTGNVTAPGRQVGGICGCNNTYATISQCYNTGAITAKSCVSGVCGYNNGITIEKCYNIGTITATVGDVGGICGFLNQGTITKGHNYGNISAPSNAGSICGNLNTYSDAITNTYYLPTTAALGVGNKSSDTTGYAEKRTAEEFADGTVYNLLQEANAEPVWGQTIGTDNYPVFYNGSNKPEPPHTHTVTLGQSELILAKGKSNWITATVSPEATATWNSGDDSIATVDSSGRVTAVGVGSTTITATVGTASASCTVYVFDVSLNPTTLEFAVGGSAQELAVTIKVPTGIELSEPPRKTDYSSGAISIGTDYDFINKTQGSIATQTYTYSVSPVQEYSEFNLAITINMKMSDNSGESGYVTVNCPVVVNAAPAPATYTVTFNANGGVVSSTFAETGTDGKLTELPTPTRTGYTFNGWFDAATGGTQITTSTVFSANTTIYAQWTAQSRPSSGGGVTRYTVKFETNGGSEIDSVKVIRNRTITEPTAPVKDGYAFDGWYTDKELTKAYDFSAKVTKSFTLYAKWEKVDDEEPENTGTHNCPSKAFDDLDVSAWYHLDTDYVLENGIFKGVSETIFEPNSAQTRAMMVTVLWRIENEPVVNYLMTFEDVDSESWYGEAVRWAASEGIIKGYSETEFGPDDSITREQIAAIMHRYAIFKGYDVQSGENTNILSYSDFDSVSEYAIASMQWAVGSGLIKGKSESTLNPQDFATRAEIAAILHRFIEANKYT